MSFRMNWVGGTYPLSPVHQNNTSQLQSYQPLLAGQHAKATHGLFNDVHLFHVWVVSENGFPVLLEPQLETGLWSEWQKKNNTNSY